MIYELKSSLTKLKENLREDPVVERVDTILSNAIECGASDIHLEPSEKNVRIRYRIDGMLHDQASVFKSQAAQVLSRIKVLASLDIAQQRLPQGGRIIVQFETKRIDLRVATFPTIHGEKLVIRILESDKKSISLENLGCNQKILQQIHQLMVRPHGFFLITGPTGSGKTTTLYALLAKLNKPERSIVTMEDPVEYHIDGITQSQINSKIDFSFENGLRSLLRLDPDIVMVGEIRDKQTAQIAIEAALTGHLVLSTLHTNDSIGAITRLFDMGIKPFLITAALTGVIAQRLVRLLCLDCVGRGCRACLGIGYKGRTGLFELLILDDPIRRLIMEGVDKSIIYSYVKRQGMSFLLDDARLKVEAGLVSHTEIVRVVGH